MFENFSLFGSTKAPKVKVGAFEFVFYKEARFHTELGYVSASSKKEGLKSHAIAFGIKGVDVAPAFTLNLFAELTEAAAEQGWVIHELVEYYSLRNTAAVQEKSALTPYPEVFSSHRPAPYPAAVAKVG